MVIVDDGSSNPAPLRELARSAKRDRRIRLVHVDRNGGIAQATNLGAAEAKGDYLVFLDHDDELAPGALEWLSTCTPEADLIYTDEDKLADAGDHHSHFFKPAWSPRLLLGVNYVNHATCIRTSLFREVGGLREGLEGVQDHDLLLRISETPGLVVRHLPNLLYHWRAWGGSYSGSADTRRRVEEAGLAMIQETIDRRGWRAQAMLGNKKPFNYRVVFAPDPTPPLVKVVIPTRDQVDLLKVAVDGVLNRTDGVTTHLVIVDNGSRKAKTHAFLSDVATRDDVSVVTIDDAFNYSRLCNEGVLAGPDADHVLLLNNDVEIRHRGWLLQLSGWLRDPEVAGVGPLLLYPKGRIQHAGVVVGWGGNAGHYAQRQRYEPKTEALYDQAREVGCLTGACLLVRTADFHAAGGLNEDFAVDFQDVDFCLRLREVTGGVLMYDPTFPGVHAESASRGRREASGYSVSRLQFLWGEVLSDTDPYYSPHLSITAYDLSLAGFPWSVEDRRGRLTGR
jgi:GT2 family glycosyltransferase